MILPEDISPEKSMYIMGGRIIDLLNREPHSQVDPKMLFDKYSSLYPKTGITYNYFLYAIDWLYLIDGVELTETGRLKKCF